MKLGSLAVSIVFPMALIIAIVAASVGARAQNSSKGRGFGVPARQSEVQTVVPAALTKHVPKGTFFDTSSSGASAFCGTAGCFAFAPIYLESIVCPRPAGAMCTYQITIHSQSNAGSNDKTMGEEGVYQFLVDGAAPSPGPVANGCACYAWSGASRQFSLTVRGTSYAVTATVTNTTSSQVHSIAVNIGCNEIQGNTSGCFAGSGFANLAIATYFP